MQRVGRWLGRTLLGLALGVAVVGLGGWLWLRGTTVAQAEGRLVLEGLREPVQVWREPQGVVHLKAESQTDLFFALGVVHSQERLWQMEFQRRVGAGRLSEVLGEATLEQDKFLRTWGFYRAAQSAYQGLSSSARTMVDAYVAGINAYLNTQPSLPIEFTVLGFRPEPWTAADVLVWTKMMSFDLSNNYDNELKRYRLLSQGVTAERLQQLIPPYPQDAPTIVAAADQQLKVASSQAGLAQRLIQQAEQLPQGLSRVGRRRMLEASNNWVVSGSRTTTGKPLLADDPHLGLGVPSLWFLAHLEAPNFEAIGATLPGLPGVVIGRNNRIAWGVTNLGADVQDLYILDEARGGYRYQGRIEPFGIRQEVIRVKGSDPVTLSVRTSRYGPVISDVVAVPGERPLALRWTSLDPDDTLLEAYLRLNQAQNWPQFVEAMRYYTTPSQNFVYADVDGNIGYLAPGRFPIRKAGHTGTVPVPGDGNWDWQGWVPFESWPQVYNPPAGYIVTANHRSLPDAYPYQLSYDWAEPYRARRITQLLESRPKLSLSDMQAFQVDTRSLLFQDFLPLLREVSPLSARAEDWKDRLLRWDGNATVGSQEASVFGAWYTELTRLPQQEVGQPYWDEPRYLLQALRSGDPGCDQDDTDYSETCADFISLALDRAIDRFGDRVPSWGQVHRAEFDHPVLGQSPLKPLSDRLVAVGGDGYTVNVADFDPETFGVSHGPSYRHIIDLSQLENSVYVHPMGQSGAPLSSNFANLLPLWQQGRYLPMRTQGYPVQYRQTLEPAPGGS